MVYEGPGVHPVFLSQGQAIDYATCRACFRSGEIRVLHSSGKIERTISFQRVESKAVKAAIDGQRFIVRADEKLIAFVELESAVSKR